MDLQTANDLAKQYFDNKEFDKAVEVLSQLSLPAELIPNLARCHYYNSNASKALELVLPLEKSQELWIDIALYYNALGDHNKAFEIYKTLDQTNPKVQFNIGWHYLRNNEFLKGFQNISTGGPKCKAWGHEYLYLETGKLNTRKKWDGTFTDHLLLILEGGLGDEIIFLRWADYLKTKTNKLTILCSRSLLRLFTNAGYDCEPSDSLPHLSYTAYVPAMSLPAIAEIKNPKLYISLPYIKSFAEPFIAKQINQIAKGQKKIGVRFYGNKEFEHDQFRSPPRDSLEALSKYGQLFSLQIDEEDGIIPNCKHLITDWQDTYSVFSALDILVTSCTSTAHLAGAMGIKAIVLVPLVPYFVWASDSMKWYGDNITIIRQTKYNDWSEAIIKLHEEIQKLL